MITVLRSDADALPPTRMALGVDSQAPGLLAVGGDLSPVRLNQAYRRGVFPWFSDGQPVLWWAPDPRMVLFTDEFLLSRSLRKTIARFAATPGCEVRFDTAFERVIQACARTLREGQSGTWIVPSMQAAYTRWHHMGAVHSVETWVGNELVGGLYAVNIGRMVFGESMFSHRTDASKIALAALVAWCRSKGLGLIDCQQRTDHLTSLGGREISRADFEAQVNTLVCLPEPGAWTYDATLWRHLDPRFNGFSAQTS